MFFNKHLFAQFYCWIATILFLGWLAPPNLKAQNSVTGAWSPIYTADNIPVAAANLPDGKILAWSAYDRFQFSNGPGDRTYTSIFDPATNQFSTTLVANTGHDMFCPGIANIGNGEIVVTGGNNSPRTSIYNPSTNTWRPSNNMNVGRGYHSMCTLTDGRVFTVGGSWSGGRFNRKAEVWSAATDWLNLDNVDSETTVRQGAPDPEGIYRDDNHAWIWAIPGGRVFQAGPGTDMHIIETNGAGRVIDAGRRGDDFYAMNGNTVMYDIGRILKNGGSQAYSNSDPAIPGDFPSSNRAYTIDISNGRSATVARVGNLNQSRAYHNSVVLPNGEVVVVGGQCRPRAFGDGCARLNAEIWNPNTGQFRQVAAMQTPRTYHSVALLMKDGRVWVGGGGLCGGCNTNHPDAEIYTPPYLYNGNALAARPRITNVPNTANYNSNISVTTNQTIQQFVLMRLSSATHSVNNEQRRIPVTFSNNGGNNYTVNIPNSDWLPPGDYFLFAMSNGVPSVGETIRIGNGGGASGATQLIANGNYYLESLPTGQHLTSLVNDNENVRMVNQGTGNDQRWEIKHFGNNVYSLKNLRSNRFLNVVGNQCTNNANVLTWTNDNDNNSKWVISKDGDNYFLRPVHCNSHALDNGNGPNKNALIYVFSPGSNNQRFKIKPVAGGGGSADAGNGTGISVFTNCNFGGRSATFDIGTYNFQAFIRQFPNDQLSSLRVPNGYQVTLYQHSLSGRTLTFTSDDNCLSDNGFNDTASSLKVERVSNNRIIVNGTHTIKSSVINQNIIAPVWNGNDARMFDAGTIFPDHRWEFNHIGDGRHTIKNEGTNRFLNVFGSQCFNNANVITWTSANSDNSRWYVELVNEAYYLIPVHCTSHALDKGTGYSKNVKLWGYNRNNDNQKFDLIPVGGGASSRNADRVSDLRATPTLGQQAALEWYYYLPEEENEVTAYTFQHYDEQTENFTDLHKVMGEELHNPNISQLKYIHEQPMIGENYYQVKIEFADGTSEYSNSRLVVFEPAPAPISIAPNPAKELLRIDLSNYQEKVVHYFIANITGQTIASGQFDRQHALVETIALNEFQNGHYYIYLRSENYQEVTQKFIVAKDY